MGLTVWLSAQSSGFLLNLFKVKDGIVFECVESLLTHLAPSERDGQFYIPDQYETFAPRMHRNCNCASLRADADGERERLTLKTIGIGSSPLLFLS